MILFDCMTAYIKLVGGMSDLYEDLTKEEYRSRATGKIVAKRKIYSTGSKISKMESLIYKNASHLQPLRTAICDYWPDLEMGKCEHSAEWFFDIAMGKRHYQRRSASDGDVIFKGNEIIDAMLTYHQIARDIQSKKITQSYPENWYQNALFLYAHTKAPNEKQLRGIREPIRNGLEILLLAYQGDRPEPSRLELWLAMNPRELFTTDEGRAERERQVARLNQGEAIL